MKLPEFNPKSPQQMSKLFFGGDIDIKVLEPIVNELGVHQQVKTGKNKGTFKYKTVIKTIYIKGLGLKPHKDWKTEKENIFSVSETTLKKLVNSKKEDAAKIAKEMLCIRDYDKQIGTYYNSVEEFIHDFDGCVHPQISHCGYIKKDEISIGGGTDTGRTSCKDPNLQNQPRADSSKVKQHFVSRYEDGVIIEFDYSSLEVVIFAYLTNDYQLIEDINNGLDIYLLAVAKIYNVDYTLLSKEDERRQIVKSTILAIVYGAGAGRISNELKITKEFAQTIINSFYERYPQAKIWQDNLVMYVNGTKKLILGKLTKLGQPVHEGHYQGITGRLYKFETTDTPKWLKDKGILTGFNPPDIKNYPVQGTATADIVLIMIGRLWRKCLNYRDRFSLVNTVHDSVIIDCKKEYIDFACKFVKDELESVKVMLKEVFDLDFNMNIKVEYKVGKSWYGDY